MATVPVGVMGGMATGQQNKGIPVLGGMAGKNQHTTPISSVPTTSNAGPANGVAKPITSPVASAGITGTPTNIGGAMSGVPPQAQATPGAGTTTATATDATGNATLAGYTPQQTQQLQKQLTDIYGKGEGGLLFNLLSNLGSNDSSYMQAYTQAMSKQTAEGLSTINTGLGNAGISSNSSAAAIEQADYLSGVTAQEGLQEQQLIQNQQQEAISLAQGLQKDSQAENSTSWLNTAAQVAGIAGTFVGAATGTSGLGSLFSGGGGGTVPMLDTSGGSDPLNLTGAPPTNTGINSPLTPNMQANLPIF